MIIELIFGAVCGGIAGPLVGKYLIKRKDKFAKKNAMLIIDEQKKKGFTFIDDGHKIEILDVNNKEKVELPEAEWSQKEKEGKKLEEEQRIKIIDEAYELEKANKKERKNHSSKAKAARRVKKPLPEEEVEDDESDETLETGNEE